MRVLCAGDLHIGRRSSRLPVHAYADDVSAAGLWTRLVDHAVAQQVDLVALGGDVVDQANRYYESLGPLERGLRRLGAAGIPTVAVSGNHDHAVLPELARALPREHFRLIGVGGRWERATITARDGSRLHVDGWSFPTRHVRENPLASHDLPAAADAPVLGLLHTDLDQPASAYAPVALADLQARAVDLWLLGHVHVPRLHTAPGRPPVLYPGSPQPLDPGEPGEHGAWLVELARGVPVVPRLVPLATVRYETCEVDVGGATDVAQVRDLVIETLRATAASLVPHDGGTLRHLSFRVRLVGRCHVHRELAREAELMRRHLDMPVGDASLHVERVDVETRPDRDLRHLANGGDAASYLARLVLALESGTTSAEHETLLRTIETLPGTLGTARAYRTLPQEPGQTGHDALRAQLAREADLLLDELLAQREVAA